MNKPTIAYNGLQLSAKADGVWPISTVESNNEVLEYVFPDGKVKIYPTEDKASWIHSAFEWEMYPIEDNEYTAKYVSKSINCPINEVILTDTSIK